MVRKAQCNMSLLLLVKYFSKIKYYRSCLKLSSVFPPVCTILLKIMSHLREAFNRDFYWTTKNWARAMKFYALNTYIYISVETTVSFVIFHEIRKLRHRTNWKNTRSSLLKFGTKMLSIGCYIRLIIEILKQFLFM